MLKTGILNPQINSLLSRVRHTNTLVEKTYQLEKTGAFTAAGTPEGKGRRQDTVRRSKRCP